MSLDKNPKEPRPRPLDPDEASAYFEEAALPEPAPEPVEQNPAGEDIDPGRSSARVESIEPPPPHAEKRNRRKPRPEEEKRVEEAMPEDREGTYGL